MVSHSCYENEKHHGSTTMYDSVSTGTCPDVLLMKSSRFTPMNVDTLLCTVVSCEHDVTHEINIPGGLHRKKHPV